MQHNLDAPDPQIPRSPTKALTGAQGHRGTGELAKEIIRDVILPEIEREVNFGQNFATLRQIYHSLILAKWYKQTVKNSIMSEVYIDKNKTAGIELDEQGMKEKIYDRYMQAYKKGVFNYIKEDYDELSQTVIPRQYFSGGFKDKAMLVGKTKNVFQVAGAEVGDQYRITVNAHPEGLVQAKSAPNQKMINNINVLEGIGMKEAKENQTGMKIHTKQPLHKRLFKGLLLVPAFAIILSIGQGCSSITNIFDPNVKIENMLKKENYLELNKYESAKVHVLEKLNSHVQWESISAKRALPYVITPNDTDVIPVLLDSLQKNLDQDIISTLIIFSSDKGREISPLIKEFILSQYPNILFQKEIVPLLDAFKEHDVALRVFFAIAHNEWNEVASFKEAAVPFLNLIILTDEKDVSDLRIKKLIKDCKVSAIMTLEKMGENAKDASQSLLQLSFDSPDSYNEIAKNVLINIFSKLEGEEKFKALHILLQSPMTFAAIEKLVNEDDVFIKSLIIKFLVGELKKDFELHKSKRGGLINWPLHSTNSKRALFVLGEMGPAASEAVPELAYMFDELIMPPSDFESALIKLGVEGRLALLGSKKERWSDSLVVKISVNDYPEELSFAMMKKMYQVKNTGVSGRNRYITNMKDLFGSIEEQALPFIIEGMLKAIPILDGTDEYVLKEFASKHENFARTLISILKSEDFRGEDNGDKRQFIAKVLSRPNDQTEKFIVKELAQAENDEVVTSFLWALKYAQSAEAKKTVDFFKKHKNSKVRAAAYFVETAPDLIPEDVLADYLVYRLRDSESFYEKMSVDGLVALMDAGYKTHVIDVIKRGRIAYSEMDQEDFKRNWKGGYGKYILRYLEKYDLELNHETITFRQLGNPVFKSLVELGEFYKLIPAAKMRRKDLYPLTGFLHTMDQESFNELLSTIGLDEDKIFLRLLRSTYQKEAGIYSLTDASLKSRVQNNGKEIKESVDNIINPQTKIALQQLSDISPESALEILHAISRINISAGNWSPTYASADFANILSDFRANTLIQNSTALKLLLMHKEFRIPTESTVRFIFTGGVYAEKGSNWGPITVNLPPISWTQEDVDNLKYFINSKYDLYRQAAKRALKYSISTEINRKSDGKELRRHVGLGSSPTLFFMSIKENKYDLNERSIYGETPLIITALKDYYEVVKALLERGANINAQDTYGYSALMNAVKMGKIDIIKLLIDKGADLNIQNDDGDTALILASYFGDSADIVRLLLDNGADPYIKNTKGQTALDKAQENGDLKIINLLKSALLESKVDDVGGDNMSERSDQAMVSFPGGIDMNIIDIDRQTSTEAGQETHTIQFNMQGMEPLLNMNIQGFTPVIVDMIPINSVLPLLGLMPTEKGIKYGQEEAQGELQLSMN